MGHSAGREVARCVADDESIELEKAFAAGFTFPTLAKNARMEQPAADSAVVRVKVGQPPLPRSLLLRSDRALHHETGCPIRRGFRRMGTDTPGTKGPRTESFQRRHSELRSVVPRLRKPRSLGQPTLLEIAALFCCGVVSGSSLDFMRLSYCIFLRCSHAIAHRSDPYANENGLGV